MYISQSSLLIAPSLSLTDLTSVLGIKYEHVEACVPVLQRVCFCCLMNFFGALSSPRKMWPTQCQDIPGPAPHRCPPRGMASTLRRMSRIRVFTPWMAFRCSQGVPDAPCMIRPLPTRLGSFYRYMNVNELKQIYSLSIWVTTSPFGVRSTPCPWVH